MQTGKTNSSKNIENLLDYLFKLNRHGIKLGLEHTIDLLSHIETLKMIFSRFILLALMGKVLHAQ